MSDRPTPASCNVLPSGNLTASFHLDHVSTEAGIPVASTSLLQPHKTLYHLLQIARYKSHAIWKSHTVPVVLFSWYFGSIPFHQSFPYPLNSSLLIPMLLLQLPSLTQVHVEKQPLNAVLVALNWLKYSLKLVLPVHRRLDLVFVVVWPGLV